MNTIDALAKRLWQPAKQLAQENISYQTYLTELSWLLWIKLIPTYSWLPYLPEGMNWQTLQQKTGQEQLEFYQTLLETLSQTYDSYTAGIFAQAQTQLTQTKHLSRIIYALDDIGTVAPDELGELYEKLLRYYARSDGSSSYVIPPAALVDVIMFVMQPQTGELIHDPLVGAGNFLVAAEHYVKITLDELVDSHVPIPLHNFIGMEQDLRWQRIALLNCFFNQLDNKGSLPVLWEDSLLANRQALPPADVIFSMLVFANEQHTPISNTSLALLRHIYQTLKVGGRAAVVLPDKVLRAIGPAQQIRRELLNTCNVHTILRLPHGIFYPHSIPVHVLFFTRGEGTHHTWFYDLRSDLPSLGYHVQLSREHLVEFEHVYGEDPYGTAARQEDKTGRWKCFDRDYLTLQNDRLDISWLQTDKDGEAEVKEFWEALDMTMQELEKVKDILQL
ncbi:MAG: N-6 DNA methylase [Thiotrichaceae bacterium]